MEPTRFSVFFSTKWNRLRINRASILQLGYPKRIRLLFNLEKKELVLQPCNENEPLSYKMPKDLGVTHRSIELRSAALSDLIIDTMGWERDVHYIAYGRYMTKDNILVFSLNDAQPIAADDIVEES